MRIAVAAVVAVVAGLLTALPAQAQTTETCSDAYYLAVRGSGQEPQGAAADVGAPTYSADTVDQGMGSLLLQQFQDLSGVTGLGIAYPAVPVDTTITQLPEYVAGYTESVAVGATSLRQALRDINFRCSSQDPAIAISGYSQGADVVDAAVGQVQSEGNTDDFAHVKSIVLFGDPSRRQGGMPELIDTRGQGLRRTLPVFPPVTPDTDTWIAEHQGILTSVCAGFDAVCDTSAALELIPSLGAGAAFGVTADVHTNYQTTTIACAALGAAVVTPPRCGAAVIAADLGLPAPSATEASPVQPLDSQSPIAVLVDLGPAQAYTNVMLSVGGVDLPLLTGPNGIVGASVTLPPGTYTATVAGVSSAPFDVASGGTGEPYIPVLAG